MICQLLPNINWLWFTVSIVVAFGIGCLWYSVLFPKTWMRIFKVEMCEKPSAASMFRTFALQIIVSILFALLFFVLVQQSVCLAAFALIAFCAWQKGTLNFQFPKLKDYVIAACIEVGYTFIVGLVFILFALI